MRAFSSGTFEDGLSKILSLNNNSHVKSFDGFPCKVTIKMTDRVAPWSRNTKTDLLFDIWKKTANALDIEIISEQRGGLSDGNWLWNKFPTLDGLGPVGANSHSSEHSDNGEKEQEYALLSSFIPKALLNLLSIIELTNSGVQVT